MGFEREHAGLRGVAAAALAALIVAFRTGCGRPGCVTSEGDGPPRLCCNTLAIVAPREKLPMEILESFPLFLKEKGAFIWKWGTPGNDRHSLWDDVKINRILGCLPTAEQNWERIRADYGFNYPPPEAFPLS